MSSLVLPSYSPLVETVKTEAGDRSSQIWLLVNPKYPAVCRDIWIPILEVIQDKVYRQLHKRIDTKRIFIKNAVSDIGTVSRLSNLCSAEIAEEIAILRKSILKHQPKILVTFGPVTYELVRRMLEINQEGPKYWNTVDLENEFERSMADFDINRTNKIPLPRRVMVQGKFIDEGNDFWEDCDNYFAEIGTKIAARIMENKDSLNIWI
ncbi:hypothetical protein REC12_02830 [Desulfosporosinus sp. PR]|uniref:hypothetical protein n=1 Tax=Candidatus Desulfosporosinus nitrosoreducens TaxID=3401928 RepID=UPI0027E673A6|nr:hypothetical protein [Desulfosporosinus sp. PR]MDQ7092520.1 hypothetical protein [Desulfosporosinus sp. PR]